MVVDIVELSVDGKSVAIENILSLTFSDEEGVKSDKITLKVLPNFPKPAPSAKIEVIFKSLKNDEVIEELNCGLFHVQTVTRTNNKALSITATGVEFNEKQKEKLSHHYVDTKLSKIVDIVAERLGHKVKFKSIDPLIKALNQTNESDVNFLERISKNYNVLFSIKNDFIYFVNKNDEALPVSKIDVSRCASSSLKHSTKTYYKSCEASFHSIDEAKILKVTVGDGKPVIKIQNAYKDEDDAKLKAQAKLDSINKGTVKGSLSLKGQSVYAGTKVELFNTYDGEDDGVFSVKSCSHVYSRNGGWDTSLDIEN